MNICIISDYFYPKIGGITENVYNTTKELIKRGHNVKLITPSPIFTSKKEINRLDKELLGNNVIRMGIAIPVFVNGSIAQLGVTCRFKQKLHKLIEENNFDIIHIHSPLFSYYGLSTIKNSKRIPIVGTFHTYFKKSFLFDTFDKLLKNYFNAIKGKIPVSTSANEILKKYFGQEGMVINNGIDLDYYNTKETIKKFNDDTINIFFIGRAEPRNGIDILIKAFEIAKKRYKKMRLIIAGNDMKTYKNLASKTNVSNDIFFVGPLRKEKPAYYNTADIHVFPVEVAALSITILEGMASSKPIITTDMQGMREIFGSNKTGIFTKFGDYKQIAKELVRLAKDKTLRDEYGKNARKRAEEFSWVHIMDKIENYYKEILETT